MIKSLQPFRLMMVLLCLAQLFARCSADSNGQQTIVRNDTVPSPVVDLTVPGNFSAPSPLRFDSTALQRFLQQYPLFQTYATDLRRFYKGRGYSYAWYDQQGLIEQAGNLYNKIETIYEEGTNRQVLYEPVLHRMMEADSTENFRQKPHPTLELMLTAQYFFYARTVWTGLGEKGMRAADWNLPRKKVSYEAMLDSLLTIPSSRFMQQEPVYPQYGLLKTWLARYRSIQQQGGWPLIPTGKKSLRNGDSSIIITATRKRLFLSGDLQGDTSSAQFDETLKFALQQFQERHGLSATGTLTPATIAALNVPVQQRIEQLLVNMERCRWLPIAFRNNYLVVNIPEFRFHAFENDTLAWSMNVVVGKAIHQTAIFTGTLRYVVFAPYWNIPPGIMQKEILPAVRRNRNYLEQNHMEWNGNMIRQKPGPWNALGKVKFLFPNSHNIYLHDTPAKDLFNRDQRAFSHGCIRVQEPRRLAIYLLRHQPEWTEKKIDEAMNAGTEQFVTLKVQVPVLIAYFTSWVDEKGRLNFRNDIYKRDQRLAAMLFDEKAR